MHVIAHGNSLSFYCPGADPIAGRSSNQAGTAAASRVRKAKKSGEFFAAG
jgi:hypothetical protein